MFSKVSPSLGSGNSIRASDNGITQTDQSAQVVAHSSRLGKNRSIEKQIPWKTPSAQVVRQQLSSIRPWHELVPFREDYVGGICRFVWLLRKREQQSVMAGGDWGNIAQLLQEDGVISAAQVISTPCHLMSPAASSSHRGHTDGLNRGQE